MNKTKPAVINYLVNPFRYIAGNKSLLIGFLSLIVLSIVAYFSNSYFSGAIGAQYGGAYQHNPYIVHVAQIFAGWLSLCFVMYAMAFVMSKSKIRFIDFAGTLAISKAPLLGFALFGFIPAVHLNVDFQNDYGTLNTLVENMMENITPAIPIIIISLVFPIWSIILMYNAYSTCSNLKGAKAGISFVAALVIVMIFSRFTDQWILLLIC
ncbi:MAG: YIP1 family protein [Prevotellaceae bacterium]|jgi:hypothetical protein|nr:YIP1 family protein [Prevotellaceae bacterium]